jgi:hypothetical protein
MTGIMAEIAAIPEWMIWLADGLGMAMLAYAIWSWKQ